MEDAFGAAIAMFGLFGGISLMIWVSSQARLERIKLERGLMQSNPVQSAIQQDNPVLEELRALKKQIADMQNTNNQFDLSFDQALTRLEERVQRIESKLASQSITPMSSEEPPVQRLGL